MQKELNLDQAIAEISRRLKRHIGSNGTAHLPVSKDFAGFMTPELLSQVSTMWPKFNELFTQRVFLPYKTDILTLGAGYYEGIGLLNHPSQPSTPTTWMSNVDVKAGQQGRKQIKIQDNLAGSVWERTIHTGGDANSGTQGWVRVYQEQTLWEGNSKMTTPVTLASSILDSNGNPNYSRFYVEYQTDTGNWSRQYGTRYGVTINITNENDEISTMAPVFYEGNLQFPTSTTAKMVRNRATVINTRSDGAAFLSDVTAAGSINIFKIVGLR